MDGEGIHSRKTASRIASRLTLGLSADSVASIKAIRSSKEAATNASAIAQSLKGSQEVIDAGLKLSEIARAAKLLALVKAAEAAGKQVSFTKQNSVGGREVLETIYFI